ncbi:hypothetical protein L861_13590 [Litchfieldella anticariensis FP35 = DSM 16096]|uniref:Type III secretion protein n=2 Tax=Litchfieldella anticariensis TaxID=258591 RepID=S2KK61_LITA3|nr:hypothetical protein L861_13590 [Halomonas anticariensis FP35 = DSM 16096]
MRQAPHDSHRLLFKATMRHRFASGILRICRFTVVTLMTSMGMSVWAASALAIGDPRWEGNEWLTKEYHYVIVEQDVRDVLTEFGRNLSLPVEISPQVRGRVRGNIRTGTAEEFLDQVSSANGLAWFFDGGVLHVATRQEMIQRTFELQGIDADRLMEAIDQSRVGDPLRARLIDGNAALQAWGPPAWIESVARRVDRLRQPTPTRSREVRVFRGSVSTKTQVAE